MRIGDSVVASGQLGLFILMSSPEEQPLLAPSTGNNIVNPESVNQQQQEEEEEDAEMKALMEDLKNMSNNKTVESEMSISNWYHTSLGTEGIQQRARLIQNDIRVYKSEVQRLTHELNSIKEKMKDNQVG